MDPLPTSDAYRLRAAQDWLELGAHLEADRELAEITPQLRSHPDVLEIRRHIYARAKRWEACVDIAEAIIKVAPEHEQTWIHRSFALHELKRTQEVFDRLLPAAGGFTKV